MNRRLKVGEIMLRAGVIDEMQLAAALGEQKKWGSRLGLVLIRLGYATENEIVQAVASQLGVPVATLDGKKIPERVLALVPYDYADAHTCLPLFIKEEEGKETLYLAMDDPSNLEVLDDLEFRTGLRVKPVVVATSEIAGGIDRFYRHIKRKDAKDDSSSGYFGTLTELVPTDNDDGFDVFSFVGRTDKPAFKESPLVADAVDPVRGESTPALSKLGKKASENGAPSEAPEASDRSNEPSTRRILHALTQLMIEKGFVTREEIFYRVKALTTREEDLREDES